MTESMCERASVRACVCACACLHSGPRFVVNTLTQNKQRAISRPVIAAPVSR